MKKIHPYYITSQLFQLVEERVASVEVNKKLSPLATVFVKLFDELDYNFSSELVPEALERLIIFIEKDGINTTTTYSKIDEFFLNDKDHLFASIDGFLYRIVEPSDEEYLDDIEDEVEYEENKDISLDDDESYIIIDGEDVINNYDLDEEITLDDKDSYLVADVSDDDDALSFNAYPIILDNAHAELITLAASTDLDELIEEQIDDLPALKEVIEQISYYKKDIVSKIKEKNKKLKEKNKKKKFRKIELSKKEINKKISKKLFNYVIERDLDRELVNEFLRLKSQINYILIQY